MKNVLTILFLSTLCLALVACQVEESQRKSQPPSVLLEAATGTVKPQTEDGCPVFASTAWFQCQEIKNQREQNRLLAELVKALKERKGP